jgi:general stress protein 26
MAFEQTDGDMERHLTEVLDSFDTAMLVTLDASGVPRARPLSIAQRESDGTLWFLTSQQTGQVLDIRDDRRVAVVLQAPRRFASLCGAATLVDDRARIEALWREAWRPWFPSGPKDPSIVVVRIEVHSAEYWDLEGLNGLKYVASALKAVVTRKRASDAANTPYHGRRDAPRRS